MELKPDSLLLVGIDLPCVGRMAWRTSYRIENGEVFDLKTEHVDMSMSPQEKEYWAERVRIYNTWRYLLWFLSGFLALIVSTMVVVVFFAFST